MEKAPETKQTEFQARLAEKEEKFGLRDEDLANLPREQIYERLYAAIGNTPIIVEKTIWPGKNIILRKDETQNPTETHYDRCFVYLIRCLEEEGTIKPGDTLLETSSGSAGIAFAWACKKLGYKSVVFMPDFVPEPRIIETQNLATEVHLSSDQEGYMSTCAKMMVQHLRENRDKVAEAGQKMWILNHSQDPRTLEAFSTILWEIINQYPDTKIDYFIGGIGNGATIQAIGAPLKQLFPEAKVIGFEPQNACPYAVKYRDRWKKLPEVLHPLHDHEIQSGYKPSQVTGTGTSGGMNFPFIEDSIQYGTIDDILVTLDGPNLQGLLNHKQQFPNYFPGTGGSGRLQLPFIDEAIKEGVLDDILVTVGPPNITGLFEGYKPYATLGSNQGLGRTSVIAEFIAQTLQVDEKVILTLCYDRADRYGEPRYIS